MCSHLIVNAHLTLGFVVDDLDNSGLIDVREELEQLTMNLLCKLQIDMPTTLIDDAIQKEKEIDAEGAFTEDQFQRWFEKFIEHAEGHSKKLGSGWRAEGKGSMITDIIFPSQSPNWPDSCAKYWIPVIYAVACLGMIIQLFV